MPTNETTEHVNLERARAYLRAIEDGTLREVFSQFFAPGVVIQWLPNRLAPNGSSSDLAGLSAAVERGKQLMSRQTYEVHNAMADGDRVVLEATFGWAHSPWRWKLFPQVARCGHTSPCSWNSATARSSPSAITTALNRGEAYMVMRTWS